MSRNKEQRSNRMMNTLRKKLLVVFLLILAAFAFLGFRLYTISRDNEEDYKKQILSQRKLFRTSEEILLTPTAPF